MRRRPMPILTMCAVALMAMPALAQRPGQGQGGPRGGQGMMMGRMSGMQLLNMPPVHQELGLSEDQIEKLNSLSEDLRSQMMEQFQALRDLDPEERQAKGREMMAEVESKMTDGLKSILEDKQMERFDQIRIQQMGISAFMSPKVEEKLKLTEDQKASIEKLMSDLDTSTREEMQAAREGGPEGMRSAIEKIEAQRKKAMDEAAATLSEEQKSAWKELVGEPFDLPRPGFGGRGGPGGPGGRRPGGGPPPQF